MVWVMYRQEGAKNLLSVLQLNAAVAFYNNLPPTLEKSCPPLYNDDNGSSQRFLVRLPSGFKLWLVEL